MIKTLVSFMLNPGCTAVLPPPCRPLPGHGRPWHSWAVPLTASAARNGHHYRTRLIPSALPVTALSYTATFILVYVSRFSAFIMFPPFPLCCYRVIYLWGKWPGAKAFPRPGRQDWGWRGDPRQGRPSDSVPWSTKDHRWCRAGLCPEIGQRETDRQVTKWATAGMAGRVLCFSTVSMVMTSSDSGPRYTKGGSTVQESGFWLGKASEI